MIEVSNLFDYLYAMWVGIKAALSLNPELFSRVFEYPGTLHWLPFWIVFGAGVSLMLGQSVVLFANRVSRARFFVSILFGALRFTLNVIFTALIFWLIADVLGEKDWPVLQTVRAIALAYAPYWLGILILVPYLGLLIEKGLKLWVFLALIVAGQAVFGLTFFQGVALAVLAYLIGWVFDLVFGRLFTPLADRIVVLVTGVKDRKSVTDLYTEFASRSITR